MTSAAANKKLIGPIDDGLDRMTGLRLGTAGKAKTTRGSEKCGVSYETQHLARVGGVPMPHSECWGKVASAYSCESKFLSLYICLGSVGIIAVAKTCYMHDSCR